LITFRDLRTLEDVSEWMVSLETRWPERVEVMQHIIEQIKALPFSEPHVVELGSGPGLLAELLLRESPQLTYTGVDSSELLLAFAQSRLAPFGQRARLVEADLKGDGWLNQLPAEIQAIVSLQSLHDLDDQSHIERVYNMSRRLLAPGGLLLNADFVISPDGTEPDHPGRLSVARHLEMLQACGFERGACTLRLGAFGCCVAYAPVGAAGMIA
jgi:SAM-dependent methyltransferase